MATKATVNRKIHIHGAISSESYSAFARRLSKLERESHTPVQVELFSEGGDAYAALAYSARIRNSPCAINITAVGLVASAAVLILAAGDHRSMGSEAWLMVHEDSGESGGSVKDMEKAAAHFRRMEDQWSQLLSGLTTSPTTKWAALHSEELYLTPEDCLELGIVDEVF